MSMLPLRDGALQIFNVEHGACALLTMPPTGACRRILIDCGDNSTTGWNPGTHLRSLDVQQLQMLVVTNYDEDHVSGLPALLQSGVAVHRVLRNPSVSPGIIEHLKSQDGSRPGRGIATLTAMLNANPMLDFQNGEPAVADGVSMEWFWNPFPRFIDENDLSLVLVLNVHGWRFMFPGDLERSGFLHMLATCPRFRLIASEIHVLIASHHGRESGVCSELFDMAGCRPELVVISDDYKQYATQETTNFYGSKATGITGFRGQPGHRRILTTRNDGQILFSFVDGRCLVS